MKNVLILGASGMAGHVIYNYLSERKSYSIIGTTNTNDFLGNTVKLDIFNIEKLKKIIDDFKPDFVINCIGMLINDANDFPDKTVYANSYFPHLLQKLCFEKSFKLIHISTDCVFSGKDGRYIEKSFKDATDVYGLSKSLGEIEDLTNLTIRTSIIGPEIKKNGVGLFHWFMNQENEVFGYKSNIWSGVTTLELAKFIDWIINNSLVGLVHLTNNDSISKYNLLKLMAEIFNKEIVISDKKDYSCDKSLVSTNVDYIVPTYEEMLIEQKKFMEKFNELYKHYSANK